MEIKRLLDQKSVKSGISIRIFLISILICVSSLSYANEKSWMDEYNIICGDTQEAVQLPGEEIKTLIDKCDKLLNKIKAADNPRKKIFIFRIEKCRNFYQFIANSKKDGGSNQ